MGRFLVPVLQVVNIVQMIVNNVRASSGARRYTLVTYQTPCLRRVQPHMKSDGRQFSVLSSQQISIESARTLRKHHAGAG